MTATVLKFIHIATIAIWAAGLICMPFLFRQRPDLIEDHDVHRMHAMVRFFYVVIVSPAAFVAIGTGTTLIFVQQTFDVWFTIKLFFVGLLVVIHILAGLVILRLFEEAEHYPTWRYVVVTAATTLVATAILVVVSAKPEIDATEFAGGLFVPGGLGERLAPLVEPILDPIIRLVTP